MRPARKDTGRGECRILTANRKAAGSLRLPMLVLFKATLCGAAGSDMAARTFLELRVRVFRLKDRLLLRPRVSYTIPGLLVPNCGTGLSISVPVTTLSTRSLG